MLKYSDHLKAVLYPENLQEVGNNVEKRLCQTIQHFSYKCQRSRNDAGFPYWGRPMMVRCSISRCSGMNFSTIPLSSMLPLIRPTD